MKKIVTSILLLLLTFKLCFSQQLISIDTAEVYILSYLDYKGNKDSCFKNYFHIMILENNKNIEQELECGPLTYQYIPFSDQRRSYQISGIVEKNFKANLIFETSYSYMDAWLSFLISQPDSLSPEFEKIYGIYRDTNINNIILHPKATDILDNRISNGIKGGSFLCTSPQPGIYYILHKVKMSYILFDDQKNIFLNTITQHTASSFVSRIRGEYFMTICPYTQDTICTILLPLTKQKQIPVALPYKVELLEPYEK